MDHLDQPTWRRTCSYRVTSASENWPSFGTESRNVDQPEPDLVGRYVLASNSLLVHPDVSAGSPVVIASQVLEMRINHVIGQGHRQVVRFLKQVPSHRLFSSRSREKKDRYYMMVKQLALCARF